MIVRPAVAEDVPRIVELWREMWDYHAAFDSRYATTPFAGEVMAAWIEKNLASETAQVLVAQDRGLVGYVLGLILENPPVVPWTQFGYVSELAVTASSRRRGAGAALVAAIHAWFRSRGLPYVEVNVSVRNAMSRAFWRKAGYADFLERLRLDL